MIDALLSTADNALRTLSGASHASRASPADALNEPVLDEAARRLSGSLMRVNHVGEVCAQALYNAQALTTPRASLKRQFEQAAREHGLDLAASWYAGDKWRDVEPALTLHGQGFLIPASSTPSEDLERAQRIGLVRDSLAAVAQEIIATLTGGQRAR